MQVNKALLLVLLFVAIISTVLTDISDEDELDPFDMVNFNPVTMSMLKKNQQTQEKEKQAESFQEPGKSHADAAHDKGEGGKSADTVKDNVKETVRDKTEEKAAPCTEKPCPQPDLNLHRRLIARILNSIEDKVPEDQADTPELCLIIKLANSELTVLENFKKSPTKERAISAIESFRESIQGSDFLHPGHGSSKRRFLEGLLGCTVETLQLTAVFIVSGAVLLLVLSKLRLTRELVKWLIFMVFIISVATTWIKLYKGEEAKQRHALMKDLPENCRMMPEDSSMFMKLSNLFSAYFTFQRDACVDYHENLIINPMVKVSIMEAISVAVVQTVLKPLHVVGTALSDFLCSLLKDLPVQWQMIAVGLFTYLLVITPFFMCGYRLQSPFISLGPSIDGSRLKALEKENRELKERINAQASGDAPKRQALSDTRHSPSAHTAQIDSLPSSVGSVSQSADSVNTLSTPTQAVPRKKSSKSPSQRHISEDGDTATKGQKVDSNNLSGRKGKQRPEGRSGVGVEGIKNGRSEAISTGNVPSQPQSVPEYSDE